MKAFITGITGQDGSYLAELLLEKGYEVHAILRRSSVFTTRRIEPIFEHPKLFLYHGDLCDSSNLHSLITKINPDEIYNLGAQSHVGISYEIPEYTAEVDSLGVVRILDAIRDSHVETKFYQASTSELFGGILGTEPQSEDTPFYPRSPYAAAKLYSYWITVNYREAYGMFACNGILFNHESPRRGGNFVTKKITQAVAKISQGKQKKLKLGRLDVKRDWGHAKDFVRGMWLMLQQDTPQDFVLAMGETRTVREFVEIAFREVGISIEWKGEGLEEKGIDQSTQKVLVEVSEKYYRPAEVELLCGDASKAERILGWKPQISFQQMVSQMVRYDLQYDDFGGDEDNLGFVGYKNSDMKRQDKIYIAGHRGLVGSAITECLKKAGYTNIVTRTHQELDLSCQRDVSDFFQQERPAIVFLAAAKVGGIAANNKYRADFIYQNLQIQNNVIHQSYVNKVKKLLFLGSSCIYPRETPQPMAEDALLTGVLEYTNEPYAIAKIAGMKLCESYNLQYGTNFIVAMPSNLYGVNDNYNLETSHVLPALLRKLHLAKLLKENKKSAVIENLQIDGIQNAESYLSQYGVTADRVEIWGTGKAMREFLYVDDLANACVFLMENVDFNDLSQQQTPVKNTHINIGTGEDVSIYDLASCIKEVTKFRGEIYFNSSKPDGTMRKLLDVSRLHQLGWRHKITLEAGIRQVYAAYQER